MMNVGEIYSVLLEREQNSSDPLDAWRIYTLIQDAQKNRERLSAAPKVFRYNFRDDSFIDIEYFRREDGMTSVRETEAFYPKAFYSKKSNI